MRSLFPKPTSLLPFRTFIGLLLLMGASLSVGFGQGGLAGQPASRAGGKSSETSTGAYPKDIHPESRNPVTCRVQVREHEPTAQDRHP